MSNRIAIKFLSDLQPSQISNIDILLVDRENVNNTKFMILTDFPDHLNLVEGVQLTVFSQLENNHDYNVITRVFLKEPPFIIIPRTTIARTSSPSLEVIVRALES
jgi:hypothetical protein